MTFKLIPVGSIKASLSKAVDLKRNTTISALFHGLVASNVSFATDMRREDMADFDTVLRQLLPVRWDKENDHYAFSDNKAWKSADLLGIDLMALRAQFKHGDKAGREELVQVFFNDVLRFYGAAAPEKKRADLDADALQGKFAGKVKASVKAALEHGVTAEYLLDMLAGMGVDVAGYVPVLERAQAA